MHKTSDYNPSDRRSTLEGIDDSRQLGEILTGPLYVDPSAKATHEMLTTQR